MEVTYGWKIGSRIKIDAGKAGKELLEIGSQITPKSVVDFASKNKSTELHKHFEWDDKKAGELYRIQQAGHLLRCITIEKTTIDKKGDKKVLTIRAFENVKNDDEFMPEKTMYVPIETALSVTEYRENVQENIRKAISDINEKAALYEIYLNNPTLFKDGLKTAMKAI